MSTGSTPLPAPEEETTVSIICAIGSAIYLLLAMVFFIWLLNDEFSNHHRLLRYIGQFARTETVPPVQTMLVLAFVGGALGGIANELRSFLVWHAERQSFGARFIWKGIVAPWVGGALALFAIAVVSSGVGMLGGDLSSSSKTQPPLPVFAIGALAGFGSREVSKWLDAQVKRLFGVEEEPMKIATVPSILSKTRVEAQQLLEAAGLKLGMITEEARPADSQVDIVIKQKPEPNAFVISGSSVDCTISRR